MQMSSFYFKELAIFLAFSSTLTWQGASIAQSDFEVRAQNLSQQIAANPKNVGARLELAEILQRSGYEELSSEQLRQLEKLAPGMFMKEFRKSVYGDGELARQFLTFGQTFYGTDPAVMYVNAQGLRYHNRYREAKEILGKLLAGPVFVPGMYSLAADIALQEERWSDALGYSSQELQYNPASKEALQYKIWSKNMLGQSLVSEQQNIQMLYYKKKTASDMGVLFADTLVRRNRYAEALEPCLFGVFCNSNKVTQAQNQKNLTRIISTMPDHQVVSAVRAFITTNRPEPLVAAMTYLKLGEALQAAGRLSTAETFYNENLKITPFFSLQTFLDLASLKEKQNDYTTAYKLFEKAISLDPSNKDVRKKFEAFYPAYERFDARKRTNKDRDAAGRLKAAIWSWK